MGVCVCVRGGSVVISVSFKCARAYVSHRIQEWLWHGLYMLVRVP